MHVYFARLTHYFIACTDAYLDVVVCFFFFLMIRRPPRSTPFPTRRSSDLEQGSSIRMTSGSTASVRAMHSRCCWPPERDRKSTRLNSSHLVISYAVFCLKKKKTSNTSLIRQLSLMAPS